MSEKEFHDLSELALNGEGQSWGNLGYWADGERSYSNACKTLALSLGKAAKLDDQSVIFDAGFGCGDQLLLWLEHFKVTDLCGINISTIQTQRARFLLEKSGHRKKIRSVITADIDDENAWRTCIEDRNISHIVALDCAYHFPSRNRFIKRASTHLRPSGRIALADFIFSDQYEEAFLSKSFLNLMLKLSRIPRTNIVTRSLYKEQLAANGFENIEVRSIGSPVMLGFSNWIRNTGMDGLPIKSRLKYAVTAAFLRWAYSRSILEYSMITAIKQVS